MPITAERLPFLYLCDTLMKASPDSHSPRASLAARRPALTLEGALGLSVTHHKPAFILWVDAVGGFLVCPSSSVVIGQAAAAGAVDIAILGDLSRKHALLSRQGEGYTVDPLGEGRVQVGSQPGKSFLAAGDTLTLGADVRLEFSRPHPLSATAKLMMASQHRTQPRTDGILLMAESCVLGPRASSHVVCPDWPQDVVLFHQNDALYCRSSEELVIDGTPAGRRGELTLASRVECGEISFTLEPM